MDELLVFVVILFVVAILGDSLLKRKFNISRKVNNMSKFARRLQFTLLTVIFIIYIVTSFLMIYKYEEFNILWIMLTFLVSISSVRGIMEWKYNHKANRWISEAYSAVIFIIFVLVISLS